MLLSLVLVLPCVLGFHLRQQADLVKHTFTEHTVHHRAFAQHVAFASASKGIKTKDDTVCAGAYSALFLSATTGDCAQSTTSCSQTCAQSIKLVCDFCVDGDIITIAGKNITYSAALTAQVFKYFVPDTECDLTCLTGPASCSAAYNALGISEIMGPCSTSDEICGSQCVSDISQVCDLCKDGDAIIVNGENMTFNGAVAASVFKLFVPQTKCSLACLAGQSCSSAYTSLAVSLVMGSCARSNVTCEADCSTAISEVCNNCYEGENITIDGNNETYDGPTTAAVFKMYVPDTLCNLTCLNGLPSCSTSFNTLINSAVIGSCAKSANGGPCAADCAQDLTQVCTDCKDGDSVTIAGTNFTYSNAWAKGMWDNFVTNSSCSPCF